MTSQVVTRDDVHPVASTPPSPARFLAVSAAAAAVAGAAAYASGLAAVPVWAMFVGWVAFYTSGHSTREGVANLLCLVLGMVLGLMAIAAVAALAPTLGSAALPLVVVLVALLVVSFRALPVLNSVLSYFLGLITVFAAHAEPGIDAIVTFGAAGALGGLAAWLARLWQGRIAQG